MINKPYYKLNDSDEKIIQNFHKEFPVRLSELTAEFNIKIYESELSFMASGQIVKDINDIYTITVRKGQSVARQRFTAAHELSHFLLHKDKIGDGIADNAMYRSGLSSILETEANKLAADILMPMSEVNKKLEDNYTIEQLSDYFEVSYQAMNVRLGIPVWILKHNKSFHLTANASGDFRRYGS